MSSVTGLLSIEHLFSYNFLISSLILDPQYVETSEFQARLGDSVDLKCPSPLEPEGRRAVSWSRSDRRPIPPKATESENKLSIPNLESEDEGTYICWNGFTEQFIKLRVNTYQGKN